MTLEPLFAQMARDFSDGNVAAIASAFVTPTEIHVGQKRLPASRPEDIAAALSVYRRNLCVESYASSDVSVSHQSDEIRGRVQVLLKWTHRNDLGAVISTVDASYICQKSAAGAWQIVVHEILPPIKPRLVRGMALV